MVGVESMTYTTPRTRHLLDAPHCAVTAGAVALGADELEKFVGTPHNSLEQKDYVGTLRSQRRGVTILAYANNHYGGHAPATVRQFRELWRAKGLPALPEPRRIQRETSLSLFDEAG